ncbi:MAG: membrane protein [Arenicella sp.]|jgi:membrane protein
MTNYSLKKTLLQLFDVVTQVTKNFRGDRLTRHAAALSFSSLLALAPMMALVFAMLSLFSAFESMATPLEDFIYQFLVPAVGDDLRGYLEQFAGQAGKLSLVGLVFFFLTALLMLFNIEESFNDIWGIGQGRTVIARITVYWSLVSLGPILMGASLVTSSYVLSSSMLTGQAQSFGLATLPLLFEMMAFLLLYLVMPNVRVSLIHALVGAFVASFLFEITKSLFAGYVRNFANYEVVYGALSTLPVFLIWIYLSWLIALIGAEVVAVLQQKKMLAGFDAIENEDPRDVK